MRHASLHLFCLKASWKVWEHAQLRSKAQKCGRDNSTGGNAQLSKWRIKPQPPMFPADNSRRYSIFLRGPGGIKLPVAYMKDLCNQLFLWLFLLLFVSLCCLTLSPWANLPNKPPTPSIRHSYCSKSPQLCDIGVLPILQKANGSERVSDLLKATQLGFKPITTNHFFNFALPLWCVLCRMPRKSGCQHMKNNLVEGNKTIHIKQSEMSIILCSFAPLFNKDLSVCSAQYQGYSNK